MTTVIVVGAGTAGLPAALEALGRGARVILVEKTDRLGGTLWVSGATISGAGARLQREQGIADSPAEHQADVERWSRGRHDPELLALATEHAGEMIDWLESLGAQFTPNSPRFAPEHELYRIPRSYNVAGPPGVAIGGGGRTMIELFSQALQPYLDTGQLDLRLGTRVSALIRDAGRVTGVRVSGPGGEEEIRGEAVILTSGGYGANAELVRRLHPQYERPLALCPSHATGDAIPLVEAAGGALTNLDLLILEPAHYEDPTAPGFTIPYTSLRGGRPAALAGEIWVNRAGRRFIAEDCAEPDAAERAIMDQPGGVLFVVMDDAMRRGLTPAIGDWTDHHLSSSLVTAPTIAALGEALGIDPDALEETVASYNASVATGRDPLGRAGLPKALDEPPFHGLRSDGTIVLTFGGVKVDSRLRVVGTDAAPIPGLFAAGEVLGGAQVMGDGFSSGMSAGPAITLGRLAARFAIDEAQGE